VIYFSKQKKQKASGSEKLRIKLDGTTYSRLYHPTWNIEYVSFSQIGSGEMGIKYSDKDNLIPVLAVRQPWASLIEMGYKTIEVRNMNTHFRGPIAIYASRSKPRKEDIAPFEDHIAFSEGGNCLPYGVIIAKAELVECKKYVSEETFKHLRPLHYAPMSYYQAGKTCLWVLDKIETVEPVDFKATSVVWSSIDRDKIQVVRDMGANMPEPPRRRNHYD